MGFSQKILFAQEEPFKFIFETPQNNSKDILHFVMQIAEVELNFPWWLQIVAN